MPRHATNTVYVEGIPPTATEREVARNLIFLTPPDIFRPYPGFRQLRLIQKNNKNGDPVALCFADFENSQQTTLVINTLQGYRFDKDDLLGLVFSYANGNNKQGK